MKNQYKLASLCCMAGLGLLTMTGCEGGDLYEIDAPDWIASRADSIAAEKAKNQGGDDELEGQNEDVYTFGKTDFSSGWWSSFSKYYVVPDGKKWQCQFNLNINPDDNTYYKNFALVVANNERDGSGYSEYGAFRYDLTTDAVRWNSNWGTVFGVVEGKDFKYTDSNLKFTPEDNMDAGLQKMNGKVTLTIDRTDANRYYMEINNGTICKTFDMPSNIAPGEDIYCFLVPEGSYIDFLSSNIEPIGGYTSREDKLPLSLNIGGLPKKILQGTSVEEAFATVYANIKFEQEVNKTVPLSELNIQVLPDMETLGTKTLIVAYNKTFKGEYCEAIIGTAHFELVDKLYTCIGATDNSTPWWGAHSTNLKVAPYETRVSTFTNYTTAVNNWNNWVMVLCREDNTEFAVVRADNYGWGAGYDGNPNLVTSGGQEIWGKWLAAMDGAKVTTYVTNNGNGTADVRSVMIGTDGETYYQDYLGILIDSDDFYYRFTVDGSHIEFDQLLGADDNSTGWWGAHSENVKVEAGYTVTRSFINHTTGNSNWNNFVVVLVREDNSEFAVVRADNYGWGAGYENNPNLVTSGGQADWGTWLAAMDGAKVTVSVTNNGDGSADVRCVMIGNDNVTYYQDYLGIAVDPNDFYYRFTVDGCHLVFDPAQ